MALSIGMGKPGMKEAPKRDNLEGPKVKEKVKTNKKGLIVIKKLNGQ